jgi:hypothetical protein
MIAMRTPFGYLPGEFLFGVYDLHVMSILQEKQCSGSG